MRNILITAFLEGMSVLVVEIAGARALAPYFGTSLHVWTAQITATLLFLAVGYGLGGVLCKRGPMALPRVLFVAGAWLALFPLWRTMLLGALQDLGIAAGAFLASTWLFGPPLLCLGSVSPLLIHRLGDEGVEGGRAAGFLFFTNTLGGLAGGWLTALVLVPNVSLRSVLAYTGCGLFAMGIAWAYRHGVGMTAWTILVLSVLSPRVAPQALRYIPSPDHKGGETQILMRVQSTNALVQVFEKPGSFRALYLDGFPHGAIDLASGTSYYPFSDYLAYAAHLYRPQAKRYLLLGLGCGVLAKSLHEMGKTVTVVEIEPKVVSVAREYFALPSAVRVVSEDARTFISRTQDTFDVVILDAYAGEAAPWYLLTVEAIAAMKKHLSPQGILVINGIARADGESAGLKHVEAVLRHEFPEASVLIEPRLLPMEAAEIVNATLVAGSHLTPVDEPYPGKLSSHSRPYIGDLASVSPRAARPGKHLDTDDLSNLEFVEVDQRLRMRRASMQTLGPEVLQD